MFLVQAIVRTSSHRFHLYGWRAEEYIFSIVSMSVKDGGAEQEDELDHFQDAGKAQSFAKISPSTHFNGFFWIGLMLAMADSRWLKPKMTPKLIRGFGFIGQMSDLLTLL